MSKAFDYLEVKQLLSDFAKHYNEPAPDLVAKDFLHKRGYYYEHYAASMRTKDCVENMSVGQGGDQTRPIIINSDYDRCSIKPGRKICAKRTAGECDLGKCFLNETKSNS
jgi:hypothetical protein